MVTKLAPEGANHNHLVIRLPTSVLGGSRSLSLGFVFQPKLGALAAVAEVDYQAQTEPDGETHPGLPVEAGDENEAEHDGQNRRDRYTRGAEAAVRVRLGLAHPQNTGRHDDERGQGADVHQLEQHVDVDEAAGERGQQTEEPRALERGTVLLVHVAEELREQAVAAHGVADAGLAVQLHEHHRGHADQRAEVHDHRR